MQDKDTASSLLAGPSCLGTPGLTACFLLFDEDVSEWEPEVLVAGFRNETGKEMHGDVFQRIMAVSALLNSPSFFNRPEIFHSICSTLLDPDPKPQDMANPPTALEMAWACTEAKLLLGGVYDSEAFDAQVKVYCGVVLAEDGYVQAPKPLSFATMPAEKYPDAASFSTDDDLNTFWAMQDMEKDNLQTLLQATLNLYKEQLLSLQNLGGEQRVFNALGGKGSEKDEVNVLSGASK